MSVNFSSEQLKVNNRIEILSLTLRAQKPSSASKMGVKACIQAQMGET